MVFASVSEIKVQYLLDINPILNPSSVILSEAKDLFLFRVNSVKDLSQIGPQPPAAARIESFPAVD
jgi:hypothetical protein